VTPEANRTALPRPLLLLGVPLAGVFLVSLFIYLGFPYGKLGDRISAEAWRSRGVRIDFQSFGPRPSVAGPGIEAVDVRATLPGGETYRIERAVLRPAWSLAWFRGSPALYVDIESAFGKAEGTLILGDGGGWSGDLEQVEIGKLPLSQLAPVGTIGGVLDASVDILLGEQGPRGQVTFEARDGSIGLANFPMEIPFETLKGELLFGGEAYMAVKRLDLEGPLVSAGVTGNVLQAASLSEAPLRLEAEVKTASSLRSTLRKAGLRVDRNGKTKIRITGTIAQPNVR
jgi:type II secretion system protein N